MSGDGAKPFLKEITREPFADPSIKIVAEWSNVPLTAEEIRISNSYGASTAAAG